MRTILLSAILAMTMVTATAQTIDFSAPVTFSFAGEPLGDVLDEISDTYNVRISYSPQLIPLDHEVYVSVDHLEFSKALDRLFEGTAVIYGFIGTQLVLSIDHDMQIQLLEPGTGLLDEPVVSSEPVFAPRSYVFVPTLSNSHNIAGPEVPGVTADVFSREFIRYESDRLWKQVERDMNAFRAQVTFVPPLQAITLPNSIGPVNLSLNVLVGVNENIEGFELGGLVNVVKGDLKGIQVAGVANAVRRSSKGFQIAGVTNVAKDVSDGMQIGGVANIAKSGGDMFQVAGVASIAGGPVLSQISCVANTATVVEGVQIAGVANSATRVKGGQVSAVLNYARKVPFQLGLINVADTSDVSIGFLSFIKNGYQSVEFAGEEVMHANLNVRLGQRVFYNILHASATYDLSSWAYGYGIGTSFVSPNGKSHVQLELMSRQINENESWSDELNLLNQFKVIWDLGLGPHMSVALGPTFNVMTSHRFDPDTDSYGSSLPLYTIFNETFERGSRPPLNVSGWLGFQVGFRVNFD